jgi:hypothetical protein
LGFSPRYGWPELIAQFKDARRGVA